MYPLCGTVCSELKGITSVCLSSDSLHLLLAGGDDGTIHVLDVLTFKLSGKVIQQEALVEK